jgi:hypothetical protein
LAIAAKLAEVQMTMNALILIVGKNLCVSHVETILADQTLANYLCVDDPDMADWIMRNGYSCDILIVDRGVFPSAKDADAWLATNPQATPIMTDQRHSKSLDFLKRLKDAVGHPRRSPMHPLTMGVH